MKWFLKNLILLAMLITIVMISKPVVADSANDTNTQTNTSGSNTNITGGYESTTTTTYEDGATNTTTSTSTTTSSSTGSDIPVNSANSPSYSSMSQDVCSLGISGSVSTLGMKVAAVSILCQDERVFEAMLMAGTPCPFEGKIGKEAISQWNKYDVERPDYETYVKKLETRSRIDEELLEIEKQEEAKRLAEEKAKKIAESKVEKTEEIIVEEIVEDKIPVSVHD